MFEEYIKDKQICQVHKHDGIMSKDKDHLLSELVDYDQNSIKYLKDDRSFLIKSIEIKFYSCLKIESCLRDL